MKRAVILYVDDDPARRATFAQLFERRLRVTVTASAEDATSYLESGEVAVLVAEQRLPGMAEGAFLQRVRAGHPTVVRIVITAHADLDECLRAVNDGLVARYVVKPWERGELEEILRWGLEVHARGEVDPAIHLRLVQAERLVALGSLTAALLHDLAQPVAVAETNASRLTELAASAPALSGLLARHGSELRAEDTERLNDLASELAPISGDLLAGLAHLQSLLDQIRELSRPPSSNDPKRADPLAVVRFVSGACRNLAARARAEVTLVAPPELPVVAVTKTELTQVVMNVVSNAIQAVAEKGGGRVAVTASVQTNALLLQIDDDGVGIPTAVMERVGTPFFSTRPEGTGLGVAQCRRIVEGAGGTFRIESTEGEGTHVFIRVPWAMQR